MSEIFMKLRPWTVPGFVVLSLPPRPRGDGYKEEPSIPVKDIPQEALDAMAGEWLGALYAKAGKPSPWVVQ